MSKSTVLIFKFWVLISFLPWQGDLCHIIFPPAARITFIMSSIIHGWVSVLLGSSTQESHYLEEEKQHSQDKAAGDQETGWLVGLGNGMDFLFSVQNSQQSQVYRVQYVLRKRWPAPVCFAEEETEWSLKDQYKRLGGQLFYCKYILQQAARQSGLRGRWEGGKPLADSTLTTWKSRPCPVRLALSGDMPQSKALL